MRLRSVGLVLLITTVGLALEVSFSFAQQSKIDMRPLWVRVGDSEGEIDVENDIASVESAEFARDGMMIASGAKKGGDVRLWDLQGNMLWQRFHENDPDDEVEVVAFTADGNYVLSGGEDFRVRVWRVSDGVQVRTLDHIASIDGMRVSHSGNWLATGDEAGQVNIWDISDPDPANWPDTSWVTVVQGPDQDRPNGGTGHSDINSIDWTTDDRFIVTAGRNALVKRWQVTMMQAPDRGHRMDYAGFHDSIKSTRLSPDGKLVVAGGQRSPAASVRVWDFETGALVKEIHLPIADKFEAVEFTPDGRFLVVGGNEGKNRVSGYPGKNGFGHIRVYDVMNDFREIHREPVFRQEYFHFNADGSLLLSSHEDGTLRLWDFRAVELPAPVIGNITVATGRGYQTNSLVKDARIYVDGAYEITAVPEGFEYHWFIQTANLDRNETSNAHLRFELLDKSAVYVAYDPRATALPAWLAGWEDAGLQLGISPYGTDHLKLYKRVFAADEVVLGGNLAGGAAGPELNYVVIAMPTNEPTSIAITAIEVPGDFVLEQNYPNPFNPATTIRYSRSRAGFVELEIFDLRGAQVATLVRGRQEAGSYTARFDAAGLPTGLYTYRFNVDGRSQVRTMILMR